MLNINILKTKNMEMKSDASCSIVHQNSLHHISLHCHLKSAGLLIEFRGDFNIL